MYQSIRLSEQHGICWRENQPFAPFFFHFHGNHKIVSVFQIKHVFEQRVHYPAVLKATTYHCSNLISAICSVSFFPFIFEAHPRKAALDTSHLEELQEGKHIRNFTCRFVHAFAQIIKSNTPLWFKNPVLVTPI